MYLYAARTLRSAEYERSTQYNCQLFYHVIKIIITSQQKEVSKVNAINIIHTIMKSFYFLGQCHAKKLQHDVFTTVCQNCAFGKRLPPLHIIREDQCGYSNIRVNKMIRIFVCFYCRKENIVVQFCGSMFVTSSNATISCQASLSRSWLCRYFFFFLRLIRFR